MRTRPPARRAVDVMRMMPVAANHRSERTADPGASSSEGEREGEGQAGGVIGAEVVWPMVTGASRRLWYAALGAAPGYVVSSPAGKAWSGPGHGKSL